MSPNNLTINSDLSVSQQPHPTFQPSSLSLSRQTRRAAPVSNIVDLSNFIFHYYIVGNGSVQETLSWVASDLASHNDLHDWDEDHSPDPVKRLAVFAKDELSRIQVNKADYMLNFNLVQEVKTTNGANIRVGIQRNTSDATSQLFPVPLDMVRRPVKSKLATVHSLQAQDTIPPNSRIIGPKLSQGRIVEIKEHISDLQRSSLLLLQLFCLRLLDEDFTFIRSFIRRHVLLETAYREPCLFQASSPSDRQDSQRCYKRVTLSFHLPHLLLETRSPSTIVDRKFVGYIGPKHSFDLEETQQCLYKAASSVLLTIATPQEQVSREEEHRLLNNPEGLWNVILVNGSWRMASKSKVEPLEYQTPLAQFIRGICSAVVAQRANILPIIHELNERLRASEDESLFDDRQFTKSRTYHWIIKSCHDLCTSIQTNLKFLHDFRINRLPELRIKANSYEQYGLEHWTLRLREEISELDKVQMEVNALREQVRELRDALHGATALLESRMAVMQGDRIKTLTYLSVAYVPLSAVSSIYSMSVLPAGATLASYFIVLSIILVLTLLAAIILQKNSTSGADVKIEQSSKVTPREHMHYLIDGIIRMRDEIWKWFAWAVTQVNLFVKDAARRAHERTDNKFLFPNIFVVLLLIKSLTSLGSALFRIAFFLILEFPALELVYTLGLLYRPPASVLTPRNFSVRKLILDLLRFPFLPLWLAIVIIQACFFLIGWLIKGCFDLSRWVVRASLRACWPCCSSCGRINSGLCSCID